MTSHYLQVREEEERRRIEDALKAEAERRLLDVEERKRIIALARHLWNKGVRVSSQGCSERDTRFKIQRLKMIPNRNVHYNYNI